jgi:D-arabinose 1-dehydrogenase-like Zn-dependent alcohol dehydrogenase
MFVAIDFLPSPVHPTSLVVVLPCARFAHCHIAAASGFPAPKLALNCIGGSSAAAIAKVLQAGGTHVTYGAMSMQPLAPPTALLIFKDITFKGFWISGG